MYKRQVQGQRPLQALAQAQGNLRGTPCAPVSSIHMSFRPEICLDTNTARTRSASPRPPPPPVRLTCPRGRHLDTDTASTRSSSDSTPGMLNVPQEWHSDSDTASTRSVSAATLSLTTTARCGPGQGHTHGRHRVPTRSARDECGDAFVSSLSSIVRSKRREVPHQRWWRRGMAARAWSGYFRRVVVQQPVHQLFNQLAERRVLASVVNLIANRNE